MVAGNHNNSTHNLNGNTIYTDCHEMNIVNNKPSVVYYISYKLSSKMISNCANGMDLIQKTNQEFVGNPKHYLALFYKP